LSSAANPEVEVSGDRGSAEKPLALLDAREAPALLWSDTEPKRDNYTVNVAAQGITTLITHTAQVTVTIQ
jgi:hypothetical protein